ncbi:hypothetical protein ACFOWU_09390 [Epilithonimonas zeae]|nr:hypothetical protein [Epilithonimonas zeae]
MVVSIGMLGLVVLNVMLALVGMLGSIFSALIPLFGAMNTS